MIFRRLIIIDDKTYDEVLERLFLLCFSETEQVSLKACTEFLNRISRKPDEVPLKWFIDDEN